MSGTMGEPEWVELYCTADFIGREYRMMGGVCYDRGSFSESVCKWLSVYR